jgi:hypothetical protein
MLDGKFDGVPSAGEETEREGPGGNAVLCFHGPGHGIRLLSPGGNIDGMDGARHLPVRGKISRRRI